MELLKNSLVARIAALGMQLEQSLANHNVLIGQKAEAEFLLKELVNAAAKELVAATNPAPAEAPVAPAEAQPAENPDVQSH